MCIAKRQREQRVKHVDTTNLDLRVDTRRFATTFLVVLAAGYWLLHLVYVRIYEHSVYCYFESRSYLMPHSLVHSEIALNEQTEREKMTINQSVITRFHDLQSHSDTNLRATERNMYHHYCHEKLK